MVRKIQSVELQLSANVVMKGESVVLTANLSDLELEQIAAQGGSFRFMLEGDPDPIPQSETNPGRTVRALLLGWIGSDAGPDGYTNSHPFQCVQQSSCTARPRADDCICP